jgi:hypothetical protein
MTIASRPIYIANHAEKLEGLPGTRLEDYFPDWTVCQMLELPGCTIKHQFCGGSGAARNNTIRSGRSYVTGHLHSPNVVRYTDSTGTRYGIDLGMLAAVDGPQFRYADNRPRDWGSSWALLNFKDGRLLLPELALVIDEQAGLFTFRGALHSVAAPDCRLAA